MVEQLGRATLYKVFGFNGTGGVWRKQAVKDAGGFTWDTVTEDIYLAYQTHLKGYEFVYARRFPQLLEVPGNILAHIQQKQRWSKGFLQVFRLHYWGILLSPNTSLTVKFEMLIHVLTPIQFVVALVGLVAYPYVPNLTNPTCFKWLIGLASIGPVLEAVHSIFSKVAGSNGHYSTTESRLSRLIWIIPYYALRLGLSIFETKAVLEGLFSDDATFHTTPKEGSSFESSLKAKLAQKCCRNSLDDLAAWLGLVLVVHQAISYGILDMHRNDVDMILHTTVYLWNVVLGTGMLGVSVAFLWERHKQQLERIIRSTTTLLEEGLVHSKLGNTASTMMDLASRRTG